MKALKSDPGNYEYFSTLVGLYLQFRLLEKAKELAEGAIAIYPDHEPAKNLLIQLSR